MCTANTSTVFLISHLGVQSGSFDVEQEEKCGAEADDKESTDKIALLKLEASQKTRQKPVGLAHRNNFQSKVRQVAVDNSFTISKR